MVSVNLHPLMNRRVVQRAEAQAFADDNGLLYVEASAKSAEGVDGTHPDLYIQMVYDSCILSHLIDAFIRTAESVWEKQKQGGFQRRNSNLGDDVRFLLKYMHTYCTYIHTYIHTCVPKFCILHTV